MKIETNLYAILDGPWKEKADAECKRRQDHHKMVIKKLAEIGQQLGLEVHGHCRSNNFCHHGVRVDGVVIDTMTKQAARSLGLKIIQTNNGDSNSIAVAPYANKKMQWMADLLEEMGDDGFAGFLNRYKKFPLGCEFVSDSKGIIGYVPRVYHSQESECRSIVTIGHDKHKYLEPPEVPDGLYVVTYDDGIEWVNGSCELELI